MHMHIAHAQIDFSIEISQDLTGTFSECWRSPPFVRSVFPSAFANCKSDCQDAAIFYYIFIVQKMVLYQEILVYFCMYFSREREKKSDHNNNENKILPSFVVVEFLIFFSPYARDFILLGQRLCCTSSNS